MDRSRAATIAAKRIAQMSAVSQIFLQRMMEQLQDDPDLDGHEEIVGGFIELMIDEGLCTRAEFDRIRLLHEAKTDQEVAAAEDRRKSK